MTYKSLGVISTLLFLAWALTFALSARPMAATSSCFGTGSPAIPPLESTSLSFSCSDTKEVFIGVCDDGLISNDDTFTATLNGELVASNSIDGESEFLQIGSGPNLSGGNILTINSTSGGDGSSTVSFTYAGTLTALTDNLAINCGPDYVGYSFMNQGDCQKAVSVFTSDEAPVDGTLLFAVQFGSMNQIEGSSIQMWQVKAGQSINNAAVSVDAPQWGRLWWQPETGGTYLLPSQYWQGDGSAASEYGVSCEGDTPSYHTSFGAAIPADDVPLFTP